MCIYIYILYKDMYIYLHTCMCVVAGAALHGGGARGAAATVCGGGGICIYVCM